MRGTSCSTGSGLWMTHRSTHSILPWDPLSWQTGKRQSRYGAINLITSFHRTTVINFNYMYMSFILFVFSLQAFGTWVRLWTGQIQCGSLPLTESELCEEQLGQEWANYAPWTKAPAIKVNMLCSNIQLLLITWPFLNFYFLILN
jgi:hypothetical protein